MLRACVMPGISTSCKVTVTTSDVYYDPYDREILADPYVRGYSSLRIVLP